MSQVFPTGVKAVNELNFAPRVEASLLNPLTWPSKAVDLAVEKAAQSINARRNTELMRLYTDTNPLPQPHILRNAAALHKTRSDWGNAAGRPAISAGAPVMNAYIGDQQAAQRQPLRGGVGPMYDESGNPIIKPYQQ